MFTMEQKTIEINLDELVRMEHEQKEAKRLAQEYDSEAYLLKTKIKKDLTKVLNVLGFYHQRNPNERYSHFPGIEEQYFVDSPNHVISGVTKTRVVQYKSLDKVLYWEFAAIKEKEFWNARHFLDEHGDRPKDWKKKRQKVINSILDNYEPQIKTMKELVDMYMSK